MTGVLPPGAPAPREPSPFEKKSGRRHGPAAGAAQVGAAAQASPQNAPRPTVMMSESRARSEGERSEPELERVREAASKEGEATRQKLQLTRDALENALRATAESRRGKLDATSPTRPSSLGRATWRGRQSWW